MENRIRFCEPFHMTAQEFYDYKRKKLTKILWYIFWMFVVSIFNERVFGYIYLTLWLIASYWYNGMCEKQWLKDGSITEDDLKY